MDNRPVVLLGSARTKGDTSKLLEMLFRDAAVKTLNLLDYQLNPYSYAGLYPPGDQFLHLMETLLMHQKIIFATPVY